MSCVEDANAATQNIAMLIWKKLGSGSVMAIAAKSPARRTSIDSTKNFFVRYMSRNAAQNGLSDHAIPMLPRAIVIWPSEYPSDLYIRVAVPPMTTLNGMPIARYSEGTHRSARHHGGCPVVFTGLASRVPESGSRSSARILPGVLQRYASKSKRALG